MIEKATVKDAPQIFKLLMGFAEKGELLPRPLNSIYDHLRDYVVFRNENGDIDGCCALQICWEDLAEIRSLAVNENCWKQGIGTKLLNFALEEAKNFKIPKVFTLTYRSSFFKMHGFKIIKKEKLPQKIWVDCINCIKFPNCDETAMILKLR